ncbi:MAG TPA: sugar transferase [Sphingomonas sp.]|jgi:lipopolysaccharide/colanic/teichoic acid biosynthesis glycosyltransferase|nr:sugar transferase [Sphingomonas sp.]
MISKQQLSERTVEHGAPAVARRAQFAIKRLLDVLGGGILLVILLPLIGIAAALVRLTSPGPAVYAGMRYGRGGIPFPCYKLRSMRIDQDAVMLASGLPATGDDGRPLLHARDPRVTPVGRWIRALSIDELPQLLNVVRGEMSLIGPRPLAISMLAPYPDFKDARSVVRPGITGLWQVRARQKNVGALDMMHDDLEYIDTYSLALDARIAVLTLRRLVMFDPD